MLPFRPDWWAMGNSLCCFELSLEEITDPTAWEGFIARQPHPTVLQSWAWGEVQQELGRRVRRLALVKDGKIAAAAQMMVFRRKAAAFAYVPYGPVLDWDDLPLAGEMLTKLATAGRSERVSYLRVDPHVPTSPAVEGALQGSRFRHAVNYSEAPTTWVLDLAGREEADLLKAMRTTTRQLIGNAKKLGITVESTTDTEKLEVFLELLRLTGARQKFIPQDADYLRLQFRILTKAGISRLYLAYHDGEARAGAIINFYGDNAAYLYGGSKPSKLPTSTAVQWAAIQDARAGGKKLYDFWGVQREDHPNKSLLGPTVFKKGFGGRQIDFPSAWDYPFHSRYHVVRAIETYYKFSRNL